MSSMVEGTSYFYLLHILRTMCRRYLPERVLGSRGTMWQVLKLATGPMCSRIRRTLYQAIVLGQCPVRCYVLMVTNATGTSPLIQSCTPMTMAYAILLCFIRISYIQPVERRWPAVLITSSSLAMIWKYPSSSQQPESPVLQCPKSVEKYFLTYTSSLLRMVSMKEGGRGYFTQTVPVQLGLHSTPVAELITLTLYPGWGLQAEPGFSGKVLKPRQLESIGPPVSVCQQQSLTSFPLRWSSTHWKVGMSHRYPTKVMLLR